MSAFDSSVVEKVKKLLARASSSEPHEAALALEMAQRLMVEHGLTAEEVEVGKIVSEPLRSVATKSKAKGWELKLYAGIAEALGCGLIFQRGLDFVTDSRMYGSYLFVGPKVEAQVCQYAAHVLQRQLTKVRARFTTTLPGGWSRSMKTAEIDAYLDGWVASALSKVSKLAPNPKRSAAISKYIRENATGSVGTNTRYGGSSDARERGAADGRDAELNRPMEGDDAKLLGS